MYKLTFEINIIAPVGKVYDVMLGLSNKSSSNFAILNSEF